MIEIMSSFLVGGLSKLAERNRALAAGDVLFRAGDPIKSLFLVASGALVLSRSLPHGSVPEMLSREAYGAINGALAAPSLVARAVAPLGAAALWAVTQNYDGVLIAIFAGAVLTAVGFWIAARCSVPWTGKMQTVSS